MGAGGMRPHFVVPARACDHRPSRGLRRLGVRPTAPAGTSTSGRTFGGRPRLRFWATILPFTNSSPPQTPHGSRRSRAPSRHVLLHRALEAEGLGRGDVVELLGEEQLGHRAGAVVAARELLPVGLSDGLVGLDEGWMANIADHSPFLVVPCRVSSCSSSRLVGWSVGRVGIRGWGRTKRKAAGLPRRPGGCSLVAAATDGTPRGRRDRPCLRAVVPSEIGDHGAKTGETGHGWKARTRAFPADVIGLGCVHAGAHAWAVPFSCVQHSDVIGP